MPTGGRTGHVGREGSRLAYHVHGSGDHTVVLVPAWPIVDARQWRLTIPHLARHHRVVVVEPRGRGGSDPPASAADCTIGQRVADVTVVMDATDTERATLVGVSNGGHLALEVAAAHPTRAAAVVSIAPSLPLDVGGILEPAAYRRILSMEHDFDSFIRGFVRSCFANPYASKGIEDAEMWGREPTPSLLLDHLAGAVISSWWLARVLGSGPARRFIPRLPEWLLAVAASVVARAFRRRFARLAPQIGCPVLFLHGDRDAICPLRWSEQAAAMLSDSRLEVVPGEGHAIARPMLINQLIDETIGSATPQPQPVGRRHPRRPRVLYLSSPIGLGHARRDLAIADELRSLVPDVEIEWLAQDPVTRVLGERNEHVHPASRWLASESGHLEAATNDHDLHVTEAIRQMDQVLLTNFSVFHEVVRDADYDLVVGDEAWDVNRFLLDEPQLKATRFAWLTDFVAALPVPDKGARDMAITAELNAFEVDKVRRHPDLRDLALFVGDLDDVGEWPLGPGLPTAQQWTHEQYECSGYITGFDPAALGDRKTLRTELGYGDDEVICIAAVGGSGVGISLLRRILAAHPLAAAELPALRTMLVAGPRIDPDALPDVPGVDKRGWVPDLHRHLVACDFAIVQGGLTTTMELTAANRPFLYIPLLNHFEQQICVPHRLARYGAGHRLDYATETPESIAEAMVTCASTQIDYAPVLTDGATRAAQRLAALL